MIHDLKPYPAYKDSGVPWLGEVPEHWEVTRLGTIGVFSASGIDKKTVEGELLVWMVNYLDIYKNPIHELRDESSYMQVSCPEWKRQVHSALAGDMFFTPSSETANDIGWSAVAVEDLQNTVYSYHVIRFRPIIELDLRFRKYMCNNAAVLNQFSQACKGTTRKVLTRNDFRNIIVTLPTLPEQSAIFHYLDYIDSRIRRYIRTKQKLIKLLEEQKQAIIHQAVTRGLDPDVKLKPSGVEWLGDVPEHWDVIALRLRYTVQLGKMLDAKQITGNYLIPYLRNIDVQWDRINADDLPKMDIRPAEYDRYTVKVGDLLVCEGGEVGRAAIWEGSQKVIGYQKALHRLRPLRPERDEPRFLYFVLFDVAKRGIFHADGSENTIAHLTSEKLRRYRFAFPSIGEQRAVINHIDLAVESVNQSISRIEHEISLLREYRTRLIADVVTGKLDVREAAAKLPEEVEEMETFDDALAEDGLEDDEIENEQAGELEEEVLV